MAILIPSRQLFIDGNWREPVRKTRIPIINPATEQIIGDIPAATAEDVDIAVEAAWRALARNGGREWASASGAHRAKYLRAIAVKTIGQAYEDMQTQNQHLLQQVAERDDYNIKVFLLLLLLICLALAKQLQQVNTSLGSLRLRIVHNEEQVGVKRVSRCEQWMVAVVAAGGSKWLDGSWLRWGGDCSDESGASECGGKRSPSRQLAVHRGHSRCRCPLIATDARSVTVTVAVMLKIGPAIAVCDQPQSPPSPHPNQNSIS
ncbi:hypothetical protein RJ640_012654 [Escallonia rubra]|uniref:Aldehyde dehydrogenase domain-containing protein n=1 Tax=Escallonia rubra TaxID=112253 RepID=A0AA88QKT0_9ASTE|nr:hypothetical protein RJ640_012654 [Escallonia rubra]